LGGNPSAPHALCVLHCLLYVPRWLAASQSSPKHTLLSQIRLETFFSNLGMQKDFHLDGKTLYRDQFDFRLSKNPLCNVLQLTLFTINRTLTFLFPP